MLNILRPKQDECFLSSSLSNKYFKMRSFSPTNLYRLSVLQSVVHTNSMIFSCYHWSKGYEMRVNWVFRNTGCLGKNVFFFSNPLQPIPCLHIAVSSHSLLLAGHFRKTNSSRVLARERLQKNGHSWKARHWISEIIL